MGLDEAVRESEGATAFGRWNVPVPDRRQWHDDADRRPATREFPLLWGEGKGEGRALSGESTPLTPALSPWEREPRAGPATTPEGPWEAGGPRKPVWSDSVHGPRAGILIAGIGFRAGTHPDEIVTLLGRALASRPHPAALGAIATAADRADEMPIRIAAEAFGLVPIPVEPAALAAVDPKLPTRSARIEASRGIGSVAEAAALAAAGAGGRLVLSRIASAGATCALALTAEVPLT